MSDDEFDDPSTRDAGVRVGGVDPAPLVVGAFVGVSGLLFLAEPYVGPLAVGGARARPIALSALVLAVGLVVGAVVYLRRGRRLVGLAHAIGGVGWGLAVAGTAFGTGALLLAGFAVVAGGSLFLVAETRKL